MPRSPNRRVLFLFAALWMLVSNVAWAQEDPSSSGKYPWLMGIKTGALFGVNKTIHYQEGSTEHIVDVLFGINSQIQMDWSLGKYLSLGTAVGLCGGFAGPHDGDTLSGYSMMTVEAVAKGTFDLNFLELRPGLAAGYEFQVGPWAKDQLRASNFEASGLELRGFLEVAISLRGTVSLLGEAGVLVVPQIGAFGHGPMWYLSLGVEWGL